MNMPRIDAKKERYKSERSDAADWLESYVAALLSRQTAMREIMTAKEAQKLATIITKTADLVSELR